MPGYQSKFLGSRCGFFGQFFDVFEFQGFQGLKESGRMPEFPSTSAMWDSPNTINLPLGASWGLGMNHLPPMSGDIGVVVLLLVGGLEHVL
jgi:hypothetical protein